MRNSDASSSYTSSDAESSTHDSGPACVDLTLERLQSLQSLGIPNDVEQSVYAKSGGAKDRVVQALRDPCCECKCRVPLQIMIKIAMAFWTLSKKAQDGLLWSLQHEAGNTWKKKWYIQGLMLFKQSTEVT